MSEREISRDRNLAGIVWSSIGLALVILTLVGVALLQFLDPIPWEGAALLLGIGSVPAMTAILLGFCRGHRARKRTLHKSSRSVNTCSARIALIGVGLLLLGIAIFAGDTLRRQWLERKWVAEAEAAVEEVLHAAHLIPEDMRERLGPFQRLSGTLYGGPSWNVLGYHYLTADRAGHFANGTIPIDLFITRGGFEKSVVQSVEKRQLILYLEEESMSKGSMEGLKITVSVPNLREL